MAQRGGRDQGNVRSTYMSNIFAGGANTDGDAVEADRTIALNVEEYGSVSVVVELTHDSATSISVAAHAAVDEAAAHYGRMHSEAIAGGVGTLSAWTRTVAVTGNYALLLNFPIKDYTFIKLIVTCAGATSTDKLNAYARASVGY